MKNILKLIIIIIFTLQSSGASSNVQAADALRPLSHALQGKTSSSGKIKVNSAYTALRDGEDIILPEGFEVSGKIKGPVFIITDFDYSLVSPGITPLKEPNLSLLSENIAQGNPLIVQTGESSSEIEENCANGLKRMLIRKREEGAISNSHFVASTGSEAFGFDEHGRKVVYWSPRYWPADVRYTYTFIIVEAFFDEIERMRASGRLNARASRVEIDAMKRDALKRLSQLHSGDPASRAWHLASTSSPFSDMHLIPEAFREEFGDIFIYDIGCNVVVVLDKINPDLGFTAENTKEIEKAAREALEEEGESPGEDIFVDSGSNYMKIATQEKIDGVKRVFTLVYLQSKFRLNSPLRRIIRRLWIFSLSHSLIENMLAKVANLIAWRDNSLLVFLGDSQGDAPVMSNIFGKSFRCLKFFLRKEVGRGLMAQGALPADTILTVKEEAEGSTAVLAMVAEGYGRDLSELIRPASGKASSSGADLKPSELALKVIEDMDQPEGKRVLSLGPGNFEDEKYLASQGCAVKAIEKNRDKYEKFLAGTTGIAPIWGDMQEVIHQLAETEAGQHDVVYARLSLHYFSRQELEKIFIAIEKLLKPGGKIYLVVKTHEDPHYKRSVEKQSKAEDPNSWLLTFFNPQINAERTRQFFTKKRVEHYLDIAKLQLNSGRDFSARLKAATVDGITDNHISQLIEVVATKPTWLANQPGKDTIWQGVMSGAINEQRLRRLQQDVSQNIIRVGRYLSEHHGELLEEEMKADGSPVTKGDLYAQSELLPILMRYAPYARLVFEEKINDPELAEQVRVHNERNADSLWTIVVDPIDGTRQFRSFGQPDEAGKSPSNFWMMGVAVYYRGIPVLSMGYSPELSIEGELPLPGLMGTFFEAQLFEDTTYCNGRPVKVAEVTDIRECRISIEEVQNTGMRTRGWKWIQPDWEEKLAPILDIPLSEKIRVSSWLSNALVAASGTFKTPYTHQLFVFGGQKTVDAGANYFVAKAGGISLSHKREEAFPIAPDALADPSGLTDSFISGHPSAVHAFIDAYEASEGIAKSSSSGDRSWPNWFRIGRGNRSDGGAADSSVEIVPISHEELSRWPTESPRPLDELTWHDQYEVGLYFQGLPALSQRRTRLRSRPDSLTLQRMAETERGYVTGEAIELEQYFWLLAAPDESFAESSGRYGAFKREFEASANQGSLWFLYPGQLQRIGDFAQEILEGDPERTVTILDYGTANGEEALSIAVYLDSRFSKSFPKARFRIIARDIITPNPNNMNWVCDREYTEIPDVVQTRYEKYFIAIGYGLSAPKEETLNLIYEFSQGDIRSILADIRDVAGQVDMVVANGVFDADVHKRAGIDDVLVDIAVALSADSRLFVDNRYSEHVEHAGDFEVAMRIAKSTGTFREIEPGVYAKISHLKASSAGTDVTYQSLIRDGKLNIFLLEKLLSEEATALLQEEIPREDMDVRVRFVGSAKYLCDDEGWLNVEAVRNFDVHAVLDKRARDFLPDGMIENAIKRASERIIQSGQSALSLDLMLWGRLNWILLLLDKSEQSRLDQAFKTIKHKSTMYIRHPVEELISEPLAIARGDDHIRGLLQRKAKDHIQLLYYFGNVESYKRYRDRFLEVFNNEDYAKLKELAIELEADSEIAAIISRIERKAVPDSVMTQDLKISLDEPKSVAGPVQTNMHTSRLLKAISSSA